MCRSIGNMADEQYPVAYVCVCACMGPLNVSLLRVAPVDFRRPLLLCKHQLSDLLFLCLHVGKASSPVAKVYPNARHNAESGPYIHRNRYPATTIWRFKVLRSAGPMRTHLSEWRVAIYVGTGNALRGCLRFMKKCTCKLCTSATVLIRIADGAD